MDKTIIAIVLLLTLGLTSCTQVDPPSGMNFFQGSFEEALALAEKENKLVFVDVYTEWCGPCKVMAQTVFPDPEVGTYFNAKFVNFKLDAEDVDINGPKISNTYEVKAYPTLLFLNADGSEIGRGVAGYDKEGFLNLAESLLNEDSKNAELLSELTARYDEGEREKAFVQEYLYVSSLVSAANYGTESSYEISQQMEPVFLEYLKTHQQDSSTLINDKDFQLIRNYAARRPKSHPAVAFVVENFDAFAQVVPEFALCYFVVECNYGTVLDLARSGDASYEDHIALLDTDLAHAHSVVAAEDPNNAILKPRLSEIANSQYLIGKRDWEGYYAEVQKNLEAATDQRASANIMGRASSWLVNSGDEYYVKKGEEFATLAYQNNKTDPGNVLSYGSVLIKSGQLEAALQIYEEMLATLDPSSPHYNFKDALERSIAHVQDLMDKDAEIKANTEASLEI